MRKFLWGLAIVAFAVSACATQETPEQRAQRMEPMLAAAGFHVHPADSPAKLANLQAMEPLAIRFKPKGNQMYYWYADPVYCTCVYVGDQAAYGRYEQLKFQQDAVLRQEEAAAMNESAATEMNMALFPDPYFYP